jgi:hypothetical protein
MASRCLAIVAGLLLGVSTTAIAASYKGRGGQIEAYGILVGTYFIGQKAAEVCGKYPSLKAESDTAGKRYVSSNKPLLDRVTQRLRQLAQMNGGEVESRRLKAEIDAALPYFKIAGTQEVSKLATGVTACNNILSNLKKGQWDLQVRHPNEIRTILGSEDQAGTPWFIIGIVEGCIDGQKRQLVKQGLSYEGNEETVRQYCHCMAPHLADIASTAEERVRMLDADPKMQARVQKIDAICLDGIKNGRRFAPDK